MVKITTNSKEVDVNVCTSVKWECVSPSISESTILNLCNFRLRFFRGYSLLKDFA